MFRYIYVDISNLDGGMWCVSAQPPQAWPHMSPHGCLLVFRAPMMWPAAARHAGLVHTDTGPVCRRYVTEIFLCAFFV